MEKKLKMKTKNKKGALAISQILILIIGIIAIGYAFGSQVGVVSGQLGTTPLSTGTPTATSSYYINPFGSHPFLPGIGTMIRDLKQRIASELSIVNMFYHAVGAFIAAFVIAALVSSAMGGGVDWDFATRFGGAVSTTWLSAESGFKAGEWAARSTGLADAGGVLGGIGTALPWLVAGIAAWVAWQSVKGWLQKIDERTIYFECKYWQPQTGGNNCESCNNGAFPCTEYQCKSLGVACDIINKDTDDQECFWNNSQDITPPYIEAWEDALLPDYEYKPIPELRTGRGVEIKYTDENNQEQECLPAWTVFTYGITLDKRGHCRIEKHTTNSFSEMTRDFGGSQTWKTEHKQWMIFPDVAYIEAEAEESGIEIDVDNNYEYYVRCENENGYPNVKEFLFKFCIEEGPDYTEPEIVGFSVADNTPIPFFAENALHEYPIEAYVNKPAQCKWSHNDRDYKDMENSMSCATSSSNINAQLLYTCTTTLTGLENRQENKFYFRCNSSYFGIVNEQSRVLTLIGTQPLVISSASPNNTIIRGSSDSIKVSIEATTSAGYQDGTAACAYSDTGHYDDYTVFDETNSHQHSTDIWLGEGDYGFYIQCFDLAGNSDVEIINFTLEIDAQAPIVVRAFREGSSLKIITDEEAECVYNPQSTLGCGYNFEDGLAMTSYDDISHTVAWEEETFYIKCKDEFGNQPAFNQCSIIVRPFEV